MIKKTIYYITILQFAFFGCNHVESLQDAPKNSDHAVVVIKNYTPLSKLNFPNGISIPTKSNLSFKNEENNWVNYSLDDIKKDTIIEIHSDSSFIELNEEYNTIWNNKYYLKSGDTLIIDYKSNISNASLLDKTAKKYDASYERFINKTMFKDSLSPSIKLRFPLAFMDRSKNIAEEHKRVLEINKAKLYNSFKKEEGILDSLKNQNLISLEDYYHRKINNYFDRLSFKIEFDKNEIYPDNVKYPSSIKGYEALIDQFSQVDSLSKYESYLNFIDKYIKSKYYEIIPHIRSKNFNILDARILYDSIRGNSFLNGFTKEYILFKQLVSISENFSLEDANQYYSLFIKDYADSKLIKSLAKEFDFNKKISSNLELLDLNGNKINFSQILSEHKNKVLYIDFWASWCKPCLEEMPKSKKMADSLGQYGIEFIYLSIDENKEKWIQSSSSQGLILNNFLVENAKEAAFLKEIELNSIPRYVVFDKNHELYQQNAPGPNSTDLIETLIDLSKK